MVNSARWRAAEIPAVNGHGTARGIAGFYVALLEGRALASTLLAEATSVQASGIDQVFGEPNAFGLGFGVDADGFGMGGLGGSYGGVSRDGYAIAFVTGSMGSQTVQPASRTPCEPASACLRWSTEPRRAPPAARD
jgi:Beta-lactamase